MGDSDEDVVLEGSALHHHLVSSGYTDMVVQEKEKCQQPSLAAELEGLPGDSQETDRPRNHMKKKDFILIYRFIYKVFSGHLQPQSLS